MKFLRYTLCLLLLGASFGSFNAAPEERGVVSDLVSGAAHGAVHGALTIPSGVLTALNTATKALEDATNQLWEQAEQAIAQNNPGLATILGYNAGLLAGNLIVGGLVTKGLMSLAGKGTISPTLAHGIGASALVAGLGTFFPTAWNTGAKFDSARKLNS